MAATKTYSLVMLTALVPARLPTLSNDWPVQYLDR